MARDLEGLSVGLEKKKKKKSKEGRKSDQGVGVG